MLFHIQTLVLQMPSVEVLRRLPQLLPGPWSAGRGMNMVIDHDSSASCESQVLLTLRSGAGPQLWQQALVV